MFGFFNIDKPPGPTSHDMVYRVRRRLPRGIKVGHAGTLDPFARGVLVVCVGPATRLADLIQAHPKRYAAHIVLGCTSTTDDTEGEVTPTPGAQPPEPDRVRQVLATFVGRIDQVPPSHSAVWVDGRRAYKIARSGGELRLSARPVDIYAIDLRRYDYPHLEIEVACGSGTYIRSLARDIGTALGVGGYCVGLTRTAVGDFTLETAVAPDDADVEKDLIRPVDALRDIPRVSLTPEGLHRLVHGKAVGLAEPAAPGQTLAISPSGVLAAIGEVTPNGETFLPQKVFVSS